MDTVDAAMSAGGRLDARAPGALKAWPETRAALLAFVARRVESREVAEDIVQDVLERLTRARPATITDLEAWWYRAARNAIVDHYRRRRTAGPLEDAAMVPAADDPGVEPAVAELAQCLRPMIEQLPGRYRDALVSVDLDGLTHTEAAAHFGISVSGMKSRVQRGRRQLAAMVEACCALQRGPTGSIEGFSPTTGCCAG